MSQTYLDQQRRAVAQMAYGAGAGASALARAVEPDYDRDDRRCLTSVVFLPRATAERIRRTVSQRLRELEPRFHYHAPDAMHITVKNVRDVHHPPLFSDRDVRKCQAVFADVVARHPAFSFRLEEVVAFASSVCVVGYCDERFRDLVLDLDRRLLEAGLPDDKRYVSDSVFFGNVTICRFTSPPPAPFLQTVQRLRRTLEAEVPAKVVRLIACDAVCSRASRKLLGAFALAAGR